MQSSFPNPATSVLNIDMPDVIQDYSVSIIDMSGKILSSDINIKSIDILELNSGIYMLQIIDTTSGKSYYSRFIKK